MFEANHIARQQRALLDVEHATTVDELKLIIRDLIENTRYTQGVRG